jgi:hypothetical protein
VPPLLYFITHCFVYYSFSQLYFLLATTDVQLYLKQLSLLLLLLLLLLLQCRQVFSSRTVTPEAITTRQPPSALAIGRRQQRSASAWTRGLLH